MADLVVKPAYVMGPTDILTVDKFNLMATPIVELSISDRVDDQNFLRNGNFYSSFWTDVTPTGISCPVGAETSNADYWSVNPTGADVTCLIATNVPDVYSLFAMEIQGNAGTTNVRVSQSINGDLSATLRRVCTFSGYIYSGAGLAISPQLELWTANAFNSGVYTLQQTEDLQTCANNLWTYVSVGFDLTNVVNITNGLRVTILIPSGALSATTKNVIFSRLKLQIGELATEFVDDVALFVQSPSVDSTMLQDGCIARSQLFLQNVVPTGAYQAKSINNGDVNDGAIDGRCLATGAIDASLGYVPVNKAGDINVGALEFTIDTVYGNLAPVQAALSVVLSSANANNAGYFPAIGFVRGTHGLAIGIDAGDNVITVNEAGTTGHLLDSVHGVDTASYQNASVTLPKLDPTLVNLFLSPGIIQMFAGPNPPGGWFICDGSAVSRTTYSALFVAIGTYWGGGDGTTTFNLPDLRGRSPLGFVNTAGSGLTNRALASVGGEEAHQISIAEMPGHDHGYSQTPHDHGTHTHPVPYPYGSSTTVQAGTGSPIYQASGVTTTGPSAVPTSSANINFSPEGGGTTHNNMSPYSVLYFIIKF